MSCKFISTEIAGLTVVETQIFTDRRGYFTESYNAAEFQAQGITTHFVQDNQSYSHQGVLRGMHYQRDPHGQAKLVRVIVGEIVDVAVDVRVGSPTFGQHQAIRLSADNQRQLLLPRGFLHGFFVLSAEAIVTYKCDNFYCPAAEVTVRYDDPELNIAWPEQAKDAVVSAKDRSTALSWEQFQHEVLGIN